MSKIDAMVKLGLWKLYKPPYTVAGGIEVGGELFRSAMTGEASHHCHLRSQGHNHVWVACSRLMRCDDCVPVIKL